MASTYLGGTASNIKVAKVGLGLMFMTYTNQIISDERCFATIKGAIDQLESDAKLLINSAEFYGPPSNGTANLEMLSRFFTKYPELAERTFLSVKGGGPSNTEQTIRRSVDACIKALGGTKKIDLFQFARIDSSCPIETTIGILKKLVGEAKFNHIGLSECRAETMLRANNARYIHPIAAAEIEVSLWSYDEDVRKVLDISRRHNVTVVGYSPMGHGYLTGKYKPEDFGDMRSHLQRVNSENFEDNMEFVRAIGEIADKKGISSASLCLAWVSSLGPNVIPIPGTTREEGAIENMKSAHITLNIDELQEITETVESHEIQGGRYFTGNESLWG